VLLQQDAAFTPSVAEGPLGRSQPSHSQNKVLGHAGGKFPYGSASHVLETEKPSANSTCAIGHGKDPTHARDSSSTRKTKHHLKRLEQDAIRQPSHAERECQRESSLEIVDEFSDRESLETRAIDESESDDAESQDAVPTSAPQTLDGQARLEPHGNPTAGAQSAAAKRRMFYSGEGVLQQIAWCFFNAVTKFSESREDILPQVP
jgi:hypothetical protein